MQPDDPSALDVLHRSMVARIATLSRNGRPSVNPLYFVVHSGRIWLGTPEWTLAARNVQADPRVSILFEVERDRPRRQVLRIRGRASVLTDRAILLAYDFRAARKYMLRPGAIGNTLAHLRQLPVRRRYRAQSAARGRSCVIEVSPLDAAFLDAAPR